MQAPALASLTLHHNNIADGGAQAIGAALLANVTLTHLDGFFVLMNVLPPEDHASPGLDLDPCYSCFRFTPFGKKRVKTHVAPV